VVHAVASQGVAKAAVALGSMLERGDGVGQDIDEAQRMFEAAEKALVAKKTHLLEESE